MPATPITNPVSGESLLGTEPQLLQQVDPGWRRRLNLFTGRALSDTALDSEQLYRGGLLATLGQGVTAGSVTGLALTIDPSLTLLTVTPGYGIDANGQDVVLNTKLTTPVASLAVVDGVTGTQQLTIAEWQSDPTNTTFAGVLLLQPVVAQVSGQQLDTGGAPAIVSGNLGASCAQDPEEYAFEDWQIADAVRLVFLPWPNNVTALPLPALTPQATLRNRLAYATFEAESMLGQDDQMPWSMLGVAVGLIAFDNTAGWTPLFVDCASVVRAGGLPRQRLVLPSQAEPLAQWAPNVNFAVNDSIADSNGNVQIATTAGQTGTKAVVWATKLGDLTHDNNVVWKENGPINWVASTEYALGQFVFDPMGYQQMVVQAGWSGALEPDWNGVYLPTDDGTVIWVNEGSGTQPIVQPALAQARVNQLSEQLSQMMAQGAPVANIAVNFPTLPPSGILPVSFPMTPPSAGQTPNRAIDFTHQSAPFLPPNWKLSAAPVRLEELETALETGMMLALLPATATASADAAGPEAVELLVPLPDAVYDPDVLVVETVAPAFQQAVNQATDARNLTLKQMATVQAEMNSLNAEIGPNTAANPNLIDVNQGLTAAEIAGRQTPPPYLPAANEIFGAALQSTWAASTAYSVGDFIIDGNGGIQVAKTAGTSGASSPAQWNQTVGATTPDNSVTWLNNGPWNWQPNTVYVAVPPGATAGGQFVVDEQGVRHVATTAGTSAATEPVWIDEAGRPTLDGVVWLASGKEGWKADTEYSVGTVILEAGYVQQVQTAGISGDNQPTRWNQTPGQTTTDSAVVWVNLGDARWQPNTRYAAGQAIVDANGLIQIAQVGGTSGAANPAWKDSGTTSDASITWNDAGTMRWQANTSYKAMSIVVDANGNLQVAVAAGESGRSEPVWSTNSWSNTTETVDGRTLMTWQYLTYQSGDILGLQATLKQPPYLTTFTDSTRASHTLNLLNATQTAMLTTGGAGLQALITDLNARIAKANDLLDTGFLTAQTDIYRYRQNVLGASAATTLATSPILANIATGETAAATATNLQNYIASLLPTTTTATTTTAGTTTPTTTTVAAAAYKPLSFIQADREVLNVRTTKFTAAAPPAARAAVVNQSAARVATGTVASSVAKSSTLASQSKVNTSLLGSALKSNLAETAKVFSPTDILFPGQNAAATTTDIISQSPLVGAQLNLRTLTIAERLQQSPSQEAMFYSIANRLNYLQALNELCNDLGFVIDDLYIVVDGAPSGTATPAAVPMIRYTFYEWRTGTGQSATAPVTQAAIQTAIQNPYLPTDASEASLYSVGVRVLEQHTTLLRAIEGRVQDYANFVSLCQTALGNMQSDLQNAQVYVTQLNHSLLQERQNVAFTSALLSDETARVDAVNAQRQQILSHVQVVAYTRPRTLEALDTAPSRQLVPANVANPIPACLQQTVSVPAELREIVGQLREAPVNWLPAVAALLPKLQRPVLLQELAVSVQARGAMMLQALALPSSAVGESGVYAANIATVYSANQQIFRGFQTQRAAIQPAALTNMSWSAQVVNLQNVAALNDLIGAASVPTEVSNATARLVQQISSVATCLYTRVSAALPIDRLAWAEFLSGPGASIPLQSLAVLPSWNSLSYSDRQQTQTLVDWLFLQIDANNNQATAFMSDVVRTAILLASDVPLDNLIPGHVVERVQPSVGGLVTLNLPSDRVAAGMYVQLYSAGNLAARAVVSDLDATTVSASVTDVYSSGTYLEINDIAHFTAQTPQAVAMRSVFGQS
jgi:hypothetical protein